MPEEDKKDDNATDEKEDSKENHDEGTDDESGDDGERENGKSDSENHQIKQLRKESAKKRIENKKLRDKLEEAEAKLAAASDGSGKDAEKAEKKAAKDVDILREVNKRYIRAELKAEALKAGLKDVDALKMFDTSGIEIDDNGDVVGVAELIEEMKTTKSWAFETTANDTTSDKKTPGKSSPSSRSALDMTDEEFEASSKKLGLRTESWG